MSKFRPVPKPTRRIKTLSEVRELMGRKRITMESNPLEESEQIKLAQWLDLKKICWCHVPNGGYRHAATANRLKAHGVKPGVPDVLIFDRPKNVDSIGCAIELKRKKGGIVSEEQGNWLNNLKARGWSVIVCRGADEAIVYLTSLGY